MTPDELPPEYAELARDAWRDAQALLRAVEARDAGAVRVVRENLAYPGLTAVIVTNLLVAAVAEENPRAFIDAWLARAGI